MVVARIEEVTERIVARSQAGRSAYLARMAQAGSNSGPRRESLPCGNQAHAFAAASASDKPALKAGAVTNVAIISAYTEMLSAHQPYERFPKIIKDAIRDAGAVAQFAGGVPAMCDGITQGQPGMEISLLSRDVIAMATAVSLSHNVFDAALCLGVCDKIVPGLLIGALSFGHLPIAFVPAGPMTSGLSNDEKSRLREQYAKGEIDRATLLEAEAQAYHGPGTCTFYGTANSNQMLMEIMGLHLPGSSFVNPGNETRDVLTAEVARRVVSGTCPPLGQLVDARALVNGIVGLVATGGSTNHTLHIVAIAQAAGYSLKWDDFSDLSDVVPLVARVHPNGPADINHFHAAGGMAFVIGQLLDAGLLHADVATVMGEGLDAYRREAVIEGGRVTHWLEGQNRSLDTSVLRPVDDPFDAEGGIKLMSGNLGRAVMKVSAVKPEHRVIEAPAAVFDDQKDLMVAFERGDLNRDVVAVVRFQGPRANGMPELHKLTTPLGVLQGLGYSVALVTDGRMSGASGKIPAAIHLTPEAASGGLLPRIVDGDVIRVDSVSGTVDVLVDEATLASRSPVTPGLAANETGVGRELFGLLRANAQPAEAGGMSILGPHDGSGG